MAPLDLSKLSPQDAAIAFRSYPRRYREALATPQDDDTGDAEDMEELAHRLGPGGRSAVQILSDVTRTWVVLRDALRRLVVDERPLLHPAVTDRSQRAWDADAPESLDDALALLTDEADTFASEIERVATGDWTRLGDVAGGGEITALDVVRDGVQVGHDGLDDVSAALTAVR
jgi:hypothetical protein